MSAGPETLRQRLRWPSLGDLGVSCLLLLVVSGVVLATQYEPGANAHASVARIETVVPAGWFVRRFHHLAGQALLLLTVAHVVSVVWRGRDGRVRPWVWAKVVGLLPLVVLGCFTGFVLRGSAEGMHAATIATSLAGSVPLVGGALSSCFYRPEAGPCCLLLPYLHHVATVTAALLYLTGDHVGRLRRRPVSLAWAAVLLGAGALVVRAPTGLPPDASPEAVLGPWFFVGIQQLLHWLPAVVAGVLVPLAGLALLWALPMTSGRARQGVLAALAGSVAGYAVLSLVGALG
jgi:ubiquinol-cytochrome c reductase cytochrome b subunit